MPSYDSSGFYDAVMFDELSRWMCSSGAKRKNMLILVSYPFRQIDHIRLIMSVE